MASDRSWTQVLRRHPRDKEHPSRMLCAWSSQLPSRKKATCPSLAASRSRKRVRVNRRMTPSRTSKKPSVSTLRTRESLLVWPIQRSPRSNSLREPAAASCQRSTGHQGSFEGGVCRSQPTWQPCEVSQGRVRGHRSSALGLSQGGNVRQASFTSSLRTHLMVI